MWGLGLCDLYLGPPQLPKHNSKGHSSTFVGCSGSLNSLEGDICGILPGSILGVKEDMRSLDSNPFQGLEFRV